MKLSIDFGLAVVIAACVCNSAIGGNPTLDGELGDGVADLIVNVNNLNARLDTNGLPITAFVLISLGGHFNAPLPITFDQHDPGLPTADFMVSSPFEASSQLFDEDFFPSTSGGPTFSEITGVINLGLLYLTLPPNLNDDLDFIYAVNGVCCIFDGTLIAIVPEPSSLTLVAYALLGLVAWGWRRHRS